MQTRRPEAPTAVLQDHDTCMLELIQRVSSVVAFSPRRQELVVSLNAKFDTGCLVFDEGNAVGTEDGLQVRQHLFTSDKS